MDLLESDFAKIWSVLLRWYYCGKIFDTDHYYSDKTWEFIP